MNNKKTGWPYRTTPPAPKEEGQLCPECGKGWYTSNVWLCDCDLGWSLFQFEQALNKKVVR